MVLSISFAPLLSDSFDYCKYIKQDEIHNLIEKNIALYTPNEQLEIVLPFQNTYMYPNKTPIYSLMKRYC